MNLLFKDADKTLEIPTAFAEINKISHYLHDIGSRMLIDGSGELIATCANDAVLYRSSTAKIDALDGKELVFTNEQLDEVCSCCYEKYLVEIDAGRLDGLASHLTGEAPVSSLELVSGPSEKNRLVMTVGEHLTVYSAPFLLTDGTEGQQAINLLDAKKRFFSGEARVSLELEIGAPEQEIMRKLAMPPQGLVGAETGDDEYPVLHFSTEAGKPMVMVSNHSLHRSVNLLDLALDEQEKTLCSCGGFWFALQIARALELDQGPLSMRLLFSDEKINSRGDQYFWELVLANGDRVYIPG